MITFSKPQHIIWQFLLNLVILANIHWFNSALLGISFGILYLWWNSKKLADTFYPQVHQGLRKVLGLLIILTYIAVNYTLAYHWYEINLYVFLWTLLSMSLVIEILSIKLSAQHYFLKNLDLSYLKLNKINNLLFPTIVIVLDIILLVALFKKASVGILRSPWELLHYKFWTLFIISNIFLVATIITKKTIKNIWLLSLHLMLMSSLGIIVYKLGFGYDSFIHEASLKIIATTGTIQPRLFIYLGQYGLTLFTSTLFQVSVSTVNRALLPVLFSILWPSTLFYGLRYGFNWSFKASYLSILWSLLLGFSFAIMTTPQSLAYLLVAIVVFLLPVINKEQVPVHLLWIISLLTLTIHPLGGIPIFFLTCILSIPYIKKYHWSKFPLYGLTTLIACVSIPLFFVIYERLNNTPWTKILTLNFHSLISVPTIKWYQTYDWPLDILHNIGANSALIYILISLLGIGLIIQYHKHIFFKRHLLFLVILISNYVVAKIFLQFSNQISYQKDDYLNRILYLIGLVLLPVFLTTLFMWFRDILNNQKDFWSKVWLIIITTIILSVSTYFSYPIYDRHGNSKSFNVTATDLKTVELIEEHANHEKYIVLANQMVGVAAISKYGFAHYYNNNFYYSMPLGVDNIYSNYLTMIEEEASREQALEAMDKAEVDRLYLVVNNYWHSAKQAIKQASETADEHLLVDEGVNNIFVFQR